MRRPVGPSPNAARSSSEDAERGRLECRLLASALIGVLLGAAPAAAQTTITCAASVTSNLSATPTVEDLKPSVLPILDYGAHPAEREFKHLADLDGVEVGLYAYRVNEKLVHVRFFEQAKAGEPGLLADVPLGDEVTQLTYRTPGSDQMVTAYCYW